MCFKIKKIVVAKIDVRFPPPPQKKMWIFSAGFLLWVLPNVFDNGRKGLEKEPTSAGAIATMWQRCVERTANRPVGWKRIGLETAAKAATTTTTTAAVVVAAAIGARAAIDDEEDDQHDDIDIDIDDDDTAAAAAAAAVVLWPPPPPPPPPGPRQSTFAVRPPPHFGFFFLFFNADQSGPTLAAPRPPPPSSLPPPLPLLPSVPSGRSCCVCVCVCVCRFGCRFGGDDNCTQSVAEPAGRRPESPRWAAPPLEDRWAARPDARRPDAWSPDGEADTLSGPPAGIWLAVSFCRRGRLGEMADLDPFLPLLAATDVRRKIALGDDVVARLSAPASQGQALKCEDIGLFVDGLVPWISNSNFKVCQNGLEVLGLLAERMKEDFRHYIQTVLPPTVDRLGTWPSPSLRGGAGRVGLCRGLSGFTHPTYLTGWVHLYISLVLLEYFQSLHVCRLWDEK